MAIDLSGLEDGSMYDDGSGEPTMAQQSAQVPTVLPSTLTMPTMPVANPLQTQPQAAPKPNGIVVPRWLLFAGLGLTGYLAYRAFSSPTAHRNEGEPAPAPKQLPGATPNFRMPAGMKRTPYRRKRRRK